MDRIVRMMTFNLRYATAADGVNSWPFRRHLLANTIRRVMPDILGTQEGMYGQLEELRSDLGGEYQWIGHGRDAGGPHNGEHSAIFFHANRLRLENHESFWFCPQQQEGCVAWGARLPRICTRATFQLLGSPSAQLQVYNFHLDHESALSRFKSVELVLRHLQSQPTVPSVVMGDMNCLDEYGPETELLRQHGFNDTFRILHPHAQHVGTFHDFTGAQTGPKIDYIWTDGNFRVLSADIMHDNEKGRYPSDHFPVTATLQLQ